MEILSIYCTECNRGMTQTTRKFENPKFKERKCMGCNKSIAIHLKG